MRQPITLPIYAQLALVLVTIYLLVHGLIVGATILVPLAFSFLLGLLLYPVNAALEKWRVPRILAILLSMVMVIIVLATVFFFISNEFVGFYDEIPELTERLNTTFNDLQIFIEQNFNVSPEAQIDWLQDKLNNLLESSGDLIAGFIFTTSGVLTQLGLVPIYAFFILYYRDLFKEFMFKATPVENHENVVLILQKVQQVIQNYLVGLFTVICIVAVLNTAALLIIGVEHAIFFALLAALLTVVPYIGVFIGSFIPVIYSLAMTGDIWQPLWIFIAFSIVQSLEGNIITPNITGSKVSLNPLAAIVALLVGGAIWGIAGMIMFVPFAAMLKVVFDHIEGLQPYGVLLGTQKDPSTSNRWLNLTRRMKKKTN